MVAYSVVTNTTLNSEHNKIDGGESEVDVIVSSCPSVVCQHVSVFFGGGGLTMKLAFFLKQYCKRRNHNQSMLCLTGLWEGKSSGLVLVQRQNNMVYTRVLFTWYEFEYYTTRDDFISSSLFFTRLLA